MTILYGSRTGLSATSVPSQLWTQGANGIPNGPGYNNLFGGALATGDFNHDGYADLAIGIPGQTFCNAVCQLTGRGLLSMAGAVQVIYGSPKGLSTTAVPPQFWSQDSPGVLDAAETNDFFGSALAVGDFNHDGFADLAIGVPGESIGSNQTAGAVNVIYGSASGLSATAVPNQFWSQGSGGLPDQAETGDQFGYSLVVGDFNHDGIADLAVGVPYEDVGAVQDAGVVHVIYGSASGLSATAVPNQLLLPGVGDLGGTAQADAEFGWSLAAGDFNGDGFADLAIGARMEPVGAAAYAGAVHVIYGSAIGLSNLLTSSQIWTQNSPNVQETAEAGECFGFALAAGDFNRDGRDDLAVGVPGESLNSAGGVIRTAGAANIIFGAGGGLNATIVPNQFLSQIYTLPPLP